MTAIPSDALLQVLGGVYQGHHVDVEPAVPVLRAALQAPEEGYFSQRLDVQVFPLARADNGSGLLAVSFSYDVPCAQAMRSLGAKYHPKARAWQVNRPRSAVDQLLQVLWAVAGVDPDYVFVHEKPVLLEDLAEGGRSASPLIVPAASPDRSEGGAGDTEQGGGFITAELDDAQQFEIDEGALASLAVSEDLRDYQVQGVRHLAGQSGACLGDDMGLGKTRQCVVAARLIAGQGRVLVLCPASLRINWMREIQAVFPHCGGGTGGRNAA
ncbi:SNF2-related protein [Aquincola sp. MAHUQ-54]|uniref:SNF2-related protein n=1 Tax=Aquincola agrisoli TaxID=3119538 RepID=A0AAW9QAD7_9BURK